MQVLCQHVKIGRMRRGAAIEPDPGGKFSDLELNFLQQQAIFTSPASMTTYVMTYCHEVEPCTHRQSNEAKIISLLSVGTTLAPIEDHPSQRAAARTTGTPAMNGTSIVIGLLTGVIGLYVILYSAARRRITRNWQFEIDSIPLLDDILPAFCGLTNCHIYSYSKAEIFVNGSIFPAMLDDIAAATSSVHFETYLWKRGVLEQAFAAAMVDAVDRGVTVRMVIDGFGSYRRNADVFDEMRDAGVSLHFFNPLRATSLHRFNERTHRKLLIVDGKIAYTGGHCIGDAWLGDGKSKDEIRDTGVRLTGPVVHGLQSVFTSGWASETEELLTDNSIFPELPPSGASQICVVSSATGDSYSYVGLAFSIAIAAARHEILIQNPYFAPDEYMLDLLCGAANRGVLVKLMLPGHRTDSALLRLAARHLYPQLLEAGVEIHEYMPSLSHQKVMVVDGKFVRVGSTNLDCRSLELNAEAGVAALDDRLAEELRRQFATDLEHCRCIHASDLKSLSWVSRIGAAGLYFFRSQL